MWDQGLTGTADVTVAVVERGTVDPGSSHVNVSAYYNIGYCDYGQGGACAASHDHATGVAGIVVALSSPDGAAAWQGMAPGVRLLSGNTDAESFGETMDATEWALDRGAHVINLSQARHDEAPPYAVGSIDAYYDYLVRHHYVTVVVAAGNAGPGCDDTQDGQIYSPGRGFNVLTVGGFDDGGTVTWSDDLIDTCSSYRDPESVHGDREEPDVVAPGVDIETLAWNDVWQNADGTSFAAPIVSGGAALLMQRDPLLKRWPEAVRAVLMASAIHNVEGDSRLSEKNGAGGVDLYLADTVVKNGWWMAEYLSAASFDAGYYEIPAYVEAGERVRVAIAWNSNPTGDYADDPLQADLDLVVHDPNGLAIPGAISGSWDNSYEIVEFEATQTGEHAIRVYGVRFDGDAEPVGVAWARVAPPEITALSVTSDHPGALHDPGLGSSGGTVYFNGGIEQTVTVEAAWSEGTAPGDGFDGGVAFGDDPAADVDGADGWTQAYSLEAGATTEGSVSFVVSNHLSPTQAAAAYVTFRADTVVGAPPLSSASHPDQTGWYSDNDVSLDWNGLSDGSGIAGYATALDHTASTVPDATVDTADASAVYDNLADGEWFFHVRAVDRVGNWSSAAHHRLGIDTVAPDAPSITSDTHPDPNTWYAENNVTFSWTTPDDATCFSGEGGPSQRAGRSSPD